MGLRNADFRRANLEGTDFRDADLIGADFRGANLEGADFRGADLCGADFNCDGDSGTLRFICACNNDDIVTRRERSNRKPDAELLKEILALQGAKFSGAVLKGVKLDRNQVLQIFALQGAAYSRKNLSGFDLSGADLSGIDLGYTKLINTNLTGTDFCGLDFSDVDNTFTLRPIFAWLTDDIKSSYIRAEKEGGITLELLKEILKLHGAKLEGADLTDASLGPNQVKQIRALHRVADSCRDLKGVDLESSSSSSSSSSENQTNGTGKRKRGRAHNNPEAHNNPGPCVKKAKYGEGRINPQGELGSSGSSPSSFFQQSLKGDENHPSFHSPIAKALVV